MAAKNECDSIKTTFLPMSEVCYGTVSILNELHKWSECVVLALDLQRSKWTPVLYMMPFHAYLHKLARLTCDIT